ncbi:hypothetical protein ABW02_04845 [Niallia circulans]|uniref:Uncharacterized protein n=1 Tax=Niallia circulans TaxID=1397 RepID=A0A0J1INK1_NIACI|nr:hypothetical protein ABW02_04845 [Niallia circulans]
MTLNGKVGIVKLNCAQLNLRAADKTNYLYSLCKGTENIGVKNFNSISCAQLNFKKSKGVICYE